MDGERQQQGTPDRTVHLPDGRSLGRAGAAVAPYLLDALLEDAAAAGLPNLRAEVLVQNRPMLALLRARGCAMAETGDPCAVDLVVGTLGTTPSWAPGSAHPRVVLEGTGNRWRLTSALRKAGVPVLRCAGPASRPATAPCPLEAGGSCPLIDGADVVIHALDADDPRSATILQSHLASGVPVLEVGRQSTDDEVASAVARVMAGEG